MRHFSGPGRISETQIHQTRLNFQHWKSLSQILMIFLYMDVWFYIWQDCLQWYCTTSAAIQVQVKTDYDDFGFKIISETRILLTSLAPYTYCEFSICQNHICTVAHHDDIDIKRCGIFLRIVWYMSKLSRILPPTQTPTQKSKNEFSIFPSQKIGSSLVSF